MLAGFNVLELGVSLVAFLSLGMVMAITSSHTALLILVDGLGALVGGCGSTGFLLKCLLGMQCNVCFRYFNRERGLDLLGLALVLDPSPGLNTKSSHYPYAGAKGLQ